MTGKALLIFCAVAGTLLYGVSAGVRGDIGLLLNPVAASSGQSYEGVSIAIALMQLAFGATQPFFGWLAMRRSNRFVLTLGAVSYAIGLALLPFVHSMPAVMVAIGLFMGAGAICFGIILSAIVQRVGEHNAMLISGILNASSGLGSTAFAPIISSLLSVGGLPLASFGLCVPVLVLLWLPRRARRCLHLPPAQDACDGRAVRYRPRADGRRDGLADVGPRERALCARPRRDAHRFLVPLSPDRRVRERVARRHLRHDDGRLHARLVHGHRRLHVRLPREPADPLKKARMPL